MSAGPHRQYRNQSGLARAALRIVWLVLTLMATAASAQEAHFIASEPLIGAEQQADPIGLPSGQQVVAGPTRHAARSFELTVPVRDGATLIGELPVVIGANGIPSTQASDLATLLSPIVAPQVVADIAALGENQRPLDPASLAPLGIDLTFDPVRIELLLAIPAALRSRQSIGLTRTRNTEVGDYEQPARVSFAANFQLNGDWAHGSYGDRLALGGSIGLIGRVGPVAWQSDHRFDDQTGSLQHSGTRLLIDDHRHSLRWQIGDLRPFSSVSRSSGDLWGIAVGKEAVMLQPDSLPLARGRQSFTVNQPSDVTVLINGQVVARRQLAPGNYDLEDFPFVAGRNQVELVVKDPVGVEQVLRFNQYLDSRLLDFGTEDYGLALGIASEPGFGRSRRYNTDDWGLNGYYLRGLSAQYTAGASVAMTDSQTSVVATLAGSTNAGLVSGRLGVVRGRAEGRTILLGGSLVRTAESANRASSNRIIRAAVDAQIPIDGQGPTRWNASTGVSWPISDTANAGFDLRASDQGWGVSLQAGWTLPQQLRLDVGLDWRANRGDSFSQFAQPSDRATNRRSDGLGVSMTLSRSLGGQSTRRRPQRQSRPGETGQNRFGQVRANYDSRQAEVRTTYSRAPRPGLGQWSHAVEAVAGLDANGIASSHAASFNRFDLATSTGISRAGEATSARASFRLSTALAWADGQIALGRPVSDSFAIIDQHASLDGYRVDLRGSSSRAGRQPHSGPLGPILVSSLSGYSQTVIAVEVVEAPPGYDLGRGTWRLRPPIYGGYRLTVGSDRALSVSGTLLLTNGRPAALLVGQAVNLDRPDHPPVTIFTNATGRFVLSGAAPGRWRLTLRAVAGHYLAEVRPQQDNHVQLDPIRPNTGDTSRSFEDTRSQGPTS